MSKGQQMERRTLKATSTAAVNAVVWIMSLEDAGERQSTMQVLTFLEPFLQAIGVPLKKFEPQSAAHLGQFLRALEDEARLGIRPIIHLDTHGGDGDGLHIAKSGEFVTWGDLANELRPINVATQPAW